MSMERELMKDLPAWWKSSGSHVGQDGLIKPGRSSIDADPLSGKVDPLHVSDATRKARMSEGKCALCGCELPAPKSKARKSKSSKRGGKGGRRREFCSTCAPKRKSSMAEAARQRVAKVQSMGTVPFRSRAFLKSVMAMSRLPRAIRPTWSGMDFSKATTIDVITSGFTSEPGVQHPTIKRQRGTGFDDDDPRFDSELQFDDGLELRVFIEPLLPKDSQGKVIWQVPDELMKWFPESEAMPKGVEPDHVGPQVCDECGEDLVIIPARGRELGAKVGARVVACSKCGLVHQEAGVVSQPSKGGSHDWSGAA